MFCCIKKDKIWKLYSLGADRLEKEFDMARIIKNTRRLNVFFKGKLMDERLRVEIDNSDKVIIDIDTEIPYEESE